MTEISYIIQNGQQINLKDAAGREMLAAKQTKLKAGKGISISQDGVISATGAGAGSFKEVIIPDVTLQAYSDANNVFDVRFAYAGNPALINYEFNDSESGSAAYNIADLVDSENVRFGPMISPTTTTWYAHAEVFDYLSQQPATDDDYLIIIPIDATLKTADFGHPDEAYGHGVGDAIPMVWLNYGSNGGRMMLYLVKYGTKPDDDYDLDNPSSHSNQGYFLRTTLGENSNNCSWEEKDKIVNWFHEDLTKAALGQ